MTLTAPEVRPVPAAIKQAVAAGLSRLAVIHRRSAAANDADLPTLVEAYAEVLRWMPPEAITSAVTILLAECDYFPKPSEWLRHARAEAKRLYESRTASVVPEKVPQYPGGSDSIPTIENDRLPLALTMCALAVEYGDGLVGIQQVDPEHWPAWHATWTGYMAVGEKRAKHPTLTAVRAYLEEQGANLRILDAATRRGPAVGAYYGVGSTPA